jgi:hypothetical protein
MEFESAVTMKIAFPLGDDQIHAVVHQQGPPQPTMVNVHDDENTSVEAGLANINRFGGRLIELVHSGERFVTFQIDRDRFSFDPNRIFSDAGIEDTLKKQSHYSKTAHAAIKSFAAKYLEHFALDREPAVIALHNTVDGIFSVESFIPSGYLGSNAASVHVNPKRSKFDFIYVTEQQFYDYLVKRDFNVVLQDNINVTDDGSMSVYFSRRHIPYINIEAEMRHLQNQIEMVNAAREMLKELLPEKRP